VVAADAAGQRLDLFLSHNVAEVSRSQLARQIGEAAVTVNGAAGTPSRKLRRGDVVVWTPPLPVPTTIEAEAISLTIVHEDRWLVVVDKPAGLVVHPAPGHEAGTLVNALLAHVRDLRGIGGELRPGIVHRIDKDTSGLLVVAKSDAAHEGLARQFADHSIERAYFALTAGVPQPLAGTVRGNIARSDSNRKKMALVGEGRGKHAVTHYKVVEALGEAALVECRLETGRTHQVRVHLASIGHALLGDPVYGRTPARLRPLLGKLGFQRQALHAAVLGFIHPISGTALRFESPVPSDIRELLRELGSNRSE